MLDTGPPNHCALPLLTLLPSLVAAIHILKLHWGSMKGCHTIDSEVIYHVMSILMILLRTRVCEYAILIRLAVSTVSC